MNVEEICNRSAGAEYTEEEMAFVIEQHIIEVKNKKVSINIKKVMAAGGDFARFLYIDQLKKLTAAFNISEAYFKNK